MAVSANMKWISACMLLLLVYGFVTIMNVGTGGVAVSSPLNDTDQIAAASTVDMTSIRNKTKSRKLLGFPSPCGTGNSIDDCWRCDPNWYNNHKRLAQCAIGFGRDAISGLNGRFYMVTDPSDDDVVNPKPGILRHAVIQTEPLWIMFQRDMLITLKQDVEYSNERE